jgi:ubiquitin C-terminal hydrolase
METLHHMAIKAWKAYHPRGFHTYDAMMEGLQVHQVQCLDCKRCYHNFEPFMLLNVEANDGGCITKGIKKYFGTEVLREWTCDHCKAVRLAEKTVRIWHFPDVLAISLKRFAAVDGFGYRKVKTPVDIPLDLLFDQESAIRGVTNGPTGFKLRSIGLHHGSMNNGHYTCVANYENKWLHYDDMNIAEIEDVNTFCHQNTFAYLLIYERTSAMQAPVSKP